MPAPCRLSNTVFVCSEKTLPSMSLPVKRIAISLGIRLLRRTPSGDIRSLTLRGLSFDGTVGNFFPSRTLSGNDTQAARLILKARLKENRKEQERRHSWTSPGRLVSIAFGYSARLSCACDRWRPLHGSSALISRDPQQAETRSLSSLFGSSLEGKASKLAVFAAENDSAARPWPKSRFHQNDQG